MSPVNAAVKAVLDRLVVNFEDVKPDLSKGKSRLQDTKAEKKLALVDDKTFRIDVFTRDKGHCRCCKRKVSKTISRVPDRAEVHHIHGRRGDLRHEPRAAVLLCCECHEKVTGKVNAKLVIVASKTFHIRGQIYTDATFPITFERVA